MQAIPTNICEWGVIQSDYRSRYGMNVASFAGMTRTPEATVRGHEAGASITYKDLASKRDVYPAEMMVAAAAGLLPAGYLITPPDAEKIPDTSVTRLIGESQALLSQALVKAIDHESDGVWTFAEVIATGRDVAGVVVSLWRAPKRAGALARSCFKRRSGRAF